MMFRTLIELTGRDAIVASTAHDPADPSGAGRVVVYLGPSVELRLSLDVVDDLVDALVEAASRPVVSRS
jgi:hypothetical protein